MTKMTEMFAIDGWDTAIVGTAFRNGHEVLVYDANKIEALLAEQDGRQEEYDDVIDLLERDDLGDNTPVFIYADSKLRDEVIAKKRGSLHLVH